MPVTILLFWKTWFYSKLWISHLGLFLALSASLVQLLKFIINRDAQYLIQCLKQYPNHIFIVYKISTLPKKLFCSKSYSQYTYIHNVLNLHCSKNKHRNAQYLIQCRPVRRGGGGWGLWVTPPPWNSLGMSLYWGWRCVK